MTHTHTHIYRDIYIYISDHIGSSSGCDSEDEPIVRSSGSEPAPRVVDSEEELDISIDLMTRTGS